MALETVVFPQELFSYTCKEWCASVAATGMWSYEFEDAFALKDYENWDLSRSSVEKKVGELDVKFASPEVPKGLAVNGEPNAVTTNTGRRKRGRAKSLKNKEEVESQRMTHIAVERNRRKQMNEYLAVLRSLMPPSYAQRGDQASIVGGAINYVKELEQLLQSLEVQKRRKKQAGVAVVESSFTDFFTFPQYSSSSRTGMNSSNGSGFTEGESSYGSREKVAENRSAVADIEVIMVDSHANLKVLTKRRSRQLVKLTAGLQCVKLMPLHLNVTTDDQMVLYSFSLKVEDGCTYSSADEIAAVVHQLILAIDEEINFN